MAEEFRASDYQQLVMDPSAKDGQLRVVTGQFLMLTPDSTFDVEMRIQLGEGAPNITKAITIKPGDTIKTATPFKALYVWHSELSGMQQLKLLVSNRPIDFNPTPQLLSQQINLKVSDFAVDFDRKVADIAFFEKEFTPTDPNAKLWKVQTKYRVSDNLSSFIVQGNGQPVDRINNQVYSKNLDYNLWLGSEDSPRDDKLITAEEFGPGALLVLVGDLQCNANLISVMNFLHRKGNQITSAAATPAVNAALDADIESRYLLTTNEDTAATNRIFRLIGTDTFSPMPNSILAESGLKNFEPNGLGQRLSCNFGRSSHSFIFFFNENFGIPVLQNSINAFSLFMSLGWIGAYTQSSIQNGRFSQAMGILSLEGWIANKEWLAERLGGWYR